MSQPTGAAAGPARPEARSTKEIEADIEAHRASLAGNIDTLQQRLSPASLAGAVKDKALSVVKRPDGSLDPVRTSVAAGVALVLVLYLVRRRRL